MQLLKHDTRTQTGAIYLDRECGTRLYIEMWHQAAILALINIYY